MLPNAMIQDLIHKHLPNIVRSIIHAEQTAAAGTPGSEKLELAATFIAVLVDIPVLPESAERAIFKVAITTVVELARALWGKEHWFQRLTETLGIQGSQA